MASILGIRRLAVFSPNSVERDEAIFAAVSENLRQAGYTVRQSDEDNLPPTFNEYDVVFSMARSKSALALLAKYEDNGGIVLNSAKALLNSGRVQMHNLFRQNGIPVPHSIANPQPGQLDNDFRFPAWLKRGDACAQSREDVSFVSNQSELTLQLANFAQRNITSSLLSEHLEGDLVKFYGVEGTPFLSISYPTADNKFSKFGLEKHNSIAIGYEFSNMALKSCADHCARLTGMPIYGGDCIVNPDGSFSIIDFNDWPSFSACRDMAAGFIAKRIMGSISPTAKG